MKRRVILRITQMVGIYECGCVYYLNSDEVVEEDRFCEDHPGSREIQVRISCEYFKLNTLFDKGFMFDTFIYDKD